LSRPKKMKRVRQFLLLCPALCLLLGMAAGGCAVPTSFSGYLEDRRQGLIDVVHLDLSDWEMGALAYVGPVQLGYVECVTLSGISFGRLSMGFSGSGGGGGGDPHVLQLGLGGARRCRRDGPASGLLCPFSRANEDRSLVGPRPKPTPSWFSVGLAAGYYPGFNLEADVYEALDFVLGFGCLDIGGDDEYVRP
jgi:hypothetical protein